METCELFSELPDYILGMIIANRYDKSLVVDFMIDSSVKLNAEELGKYKDYALTNEKMQNYLAVGRKTNLLSVGQGYYILLRNGVLTKEMFTYDITDEEES